MNPTLLEDKLVSSAALLKQFADELDDIERDRDDAAQRFIVERLVGFDHRSHTTERKEDPPPSVARAWAKARMCSPFT